MIANSIGAFFALSSLDETLVDRAYLISPVVDMEKLICNMMKWANVTEQELVEKREIATNIIGSENVDRNMFAADHTKSLIREKEKSYVRKEYYHSSGNKRRLQSC